MYYCFECANKLLARFPFWEFDVDTKVFICSNCKRKRPCIINVKKRAIGKIDFENFDSFFKSVIQEMLERWDDTDFQEEKRTFYKTLFLSNIHKDIFQ